MRGSEYKQHSLFISRLWCYQGMKFYQAFNKMQMGYEYLDPTYVNVFVKSILYQCGLNKSSEVTASNLQLCGNMLLREKDVRENRIKDATNWLVSAGIMEQRSHEAEEIESKLGQILSETLVDEYEFYDTVHKSKTFKSLFKDAAEAEHFLPFYDQFESISELISMVRKAITKKLVS